jgi:hypothetical protein
MKGKQNPIGLFAILGMLLLATAPLATADGGTAPPSYAFLPSWDGAISGTLDSTGESVLNGLEFTNHDFDDEGNLYFIESEDYANWMGGQFAAGQRGFHLMKVTPSGQIEYTETITCSNYCNNPDYAYSKVVGMHVIDEDRFYLVLSSYYASLTFSGQSYYSGSQQTLTTAFYDNGSWSWVEQEYTSGYAHATIRHMETDEAGNFYTVMFNGNSGSWSEYSISSFSPNGTNWVRTLELPYQSPTYNYIAPLFDVDSTGLHAFVTVQGQFKYDSQTVQCPSGGEEGVCHMWLSLSTSGVKSSAVGAPYTSVQFNRMQVHNDSVYLSGNTYDRVVGSHTESNFTGQKISHSPRYGQYVAVMENDGSWGYHLVVNQLQNSYYNYGYLTDVLEDGSLIFNAIYPEAASVDGAGVTAYPNADVESILMRIHPDTGLEWSTSVGFTNANTVPFTMRSDGSTVAFHVQDRSNGDIYYTYQSQPQNPPDNGTTSNYVFWVDLDDGQIVDVEPTSATGVYGRSPEGGVLAARNSWMYYFMPDFDGDNVGTGDNCPENFNPDQLDYNSDGTGDACDSDDDSDGVEDVSDSCPRGETGWISDELTDYDGDGCKDRSEEDLDDDADGVPDITDACPVGIGGAGYDLDGDGCKDVEDTDDDGDTVRDESDLCSTGATDWASGTLTDHDGDGCKDEDPEDADDDNDGIADTLDQCPRGATDWPSNINTDFDGDGCKDGFEDEDDDDDGISNAIDDCPRSIGVVNANGCSATQTLEEDGGSSTVYYVCPVGSIVVLDPSDCPEDQGSNQNENQSGETSETFYYVCPGGSDVVTDLSECEGSIGEGGTNITLIVDPSSNASGDYITCEGGKAIVLDRANCPESITQDAASSTSDQEENNLMVLFMGGTFAMSAIAMVVVLVRRPTQGGPTFQAMDSSDRLFKEEPELPKAVSLPSPPASKSSPPGGGPSTDLIGVSHDGQEWIEWPQGSDNHYYRELGYGGTWTKYEG